MIKSRKPSHLWKALAILVLILIGLTIVYMFLQKKESFVAGRPGSDIVKKEVKVIYYYLPGCPYCVQFKPTWDSFSAEFAGKASFSMIDGSSNEVPENVKGFPHVDFVVNGKATTYEGDRSIRDLRNTLNKHLSA